MNCTTATPETDGRRKEIMRLVEESLRALNGQASDLEMVILNANVAPEEVTDYFGSLNQLMMHMVTALSENLLIPLGGHSSTETAFADILRHFGKGMARAYQDFYLIGLYRIALTEATRHTEACKAFFEHGPGLITNRLAEVFDKYRRVGEISDGDMQLRADHFLAILRSKVEIPNAKALSEGELDALVDEAVRITCWGIKGEHT